jgi:hypothetical protein
MVVTSAFADLLKRTETSAAGQAMSNVKQAWFPPLPREVLFLQALLFQIQFSLDQAECLIINAASIA